MEPNKTPVQAPAKPKAAISVMERGGTILTAIAALGMAGAGGYWENAAFTGNVALTVAQLKTVLLDGTIGVASIGVLALIASIINIPHLIGHMRRGPITSSIFSVATLAAAAAFLFLTLLPKAQVATFAVTMQDKCQTPLTAITDKNTGDIALASKAASADAGNDTQFVADMNKYAQTFQADATIATNAAAELGKITPPNKKYQGLINDCKQEFLDTANFLTAPTGVTLPTSVPPPFGGQSISAAGLLVTSAKLVTGTSGLPGVTQPIPSLLVSQVVSGVLNAALDTCSPTCHRLTDPGAEADQLKSDTFAPFKEQS